ncbi:hypothetical protein DEU56DRAFT_918390 [Suillus clintonianus]|uniref:uncharacterized protein n=1 Tax=Suillus clintonianus TaxID=1904413 RepID=UPI001B87AB56|nr:uncharacterized protein DEU56DRAFT_918390 [Suillus clintonianus]KAG2120396.1 hypothetical protein DEU56DRAFT_918390 [Suillus clintonianus]
MSRTTDDEDPGRRRQGVVSSAQHLPSPHSDPNTDPDADGKGDADVDAELREAADAAADHRSASSAGMKEEDIEVREYPPSGFSGTPHALGSIDRALTLFPLLGDLRAIASPAVW